MNSKLLTIHIDGKRKRSATLPWSVVNSGKSVLHHSRFNGIQFWMGLAHALCHYWIFPFLSAIKWDRSKSRTLYIICFRPRGFLVEHIQHCCDCWMVYRNSWGMEPYSPHHPILAQDPPLMLSSFDRTCWRPATFHIWFMCQLSASIRPHCPSAPAISPETCPILNDIDQVGSQKVSITTTIGGSWTGGKRRHERIHHFSKYDPKVGLYVCN